MERRGEECAHTTANDSRNLQGLCPFSSRRQGRGGAGGKREQRPRMVLAKFNFASRHFYFSLISSDLFIAIKGHPSFFEGCFRSIVLLLRLLKYLIGITSRKFFFFEYDITLQLSIEKKKKETFPTKLQKSENRSSPLPSLGIPNPRPSMKRKGWTPMCRKAGASNVKRARRRESANPPHPTLDVINPRQGPIQPFRSKDYPRNATPFVDPSSLPFSLLDLPPPSLDLIPGSPRRDAENAPFSGHEGMKEGKGDT